LYSTQDATTQRFKAPMLKGEEVAHIEQVGWGRCWGVEVLDWS